MVQNAIFKYKMSVILVGLALLSSFWILGYDIGPYSLRVYLLLILIGIIGLDLVQRKSSLFSLIYSRNVFFAYILLVIWTFYVDILSGQGFHHTTMTYLATHAVSIVGFVCVQYFVKTEREILFFTKLVILAALVSAFVAVMQFLQVDFFWELSDVMNPAFKSAPGGIYRIYHPPGLAFYSIALSYHVITLGGFLWALLYLYQGNLSRSRTIFSIILWLLSSVMLMAILITRSRSAILSLVVCFLLLLWFGVLSRYKRIFRPKRAYVVTVLVFIIMIGEVLALNRYQTGSWNLKVAHPLSGNFGRLLQMKDDYRMKSFSASFSVFRELLFGIEGLDSDKDKIVQVDNRINWPRIQRILLGPGLGAYKAKFRVIGPHNMIVSSLLRYGFIGFFVLCGLLYYIFALCRAVLKKQSNFPTLYFVIYGGVVGILANAINSLFHNDSYLYGTFVPWWIIGLLCSVIQLGSTEESLID